MPQQGHSPPGAAPLQRALAHAKAAATAGLECVQELVGAVAPEGQPVKHPGENVPAGMLKLTLHDVELEAPSLCFCVLKIGPHWGRTTTLMAAPKAAWEWEVGPPACAWGLQLQCCI